MHVIISTIYNISSRVVLDLQIRAAGEFLCILFNVDANVARSATFLNCRNSRLFAKFLVTCSRFCTMRICSPEPQRKQEFANLFDWQKCSR